MKAIKIDNKDQYNTFVAKQNFAQFLQSYDWGEFQRQLGNQVLPLMIFDHDKILGIALLIKKKIPFLNKYYWYCPRGPIMDSTYDSTYDSMYYSIISTLVEKLESEANKDNVIFVRLDPVFSFKFKNLSGIKTIDIQPPQTVILDLSQSKEELLANMHQKTRYNVRLSHRKGVEVRKAWAGEFDKFWRFMEATADRDGFRLHNQKHYKKMIETAPDIFQLFLAEYQGEIIAGNLICFFGDTVTYVHGASEYKFRKVMAPYALQWWVVSLAKDRGFRYYDFYGVDSDKWPGVTRFKQGFGGKKQEYPGTYDIVFDKKWYLFYKCGRKLRRVI